MSSSSLFILSNSAVEIQSHLNMDILLLIIAFMGIFKGIKGEKKGNVTSRNKDPCLRIVGGCNAKPYSIPWQVIYKGQNFCGGSILDKKTVVTAAHCCVGIGKGYVIAGTLHSSETLAEPFTQKVMVKEAIQHPEHMESSGAEVNDICILKLESSLKFNKKVKAVKLPEKDQKFTGRATVSGWGRTIPIRERTLSRQYAKLQVVMVPLVAFKTCRDAYKKRALPILKDEMICAGSGGKDSCFGDSGGPLICDGNFLCGVVSFGYGCAQEEYPGVYARVTNYIDFIKKNMG